jgi:CHAT domain-containing protein
LNRASRLQDLPGAESEAKAIAALYGPSKLLIGRQATKTAFLASLPQSEIVHFAGHAVAGAELGEGALLFAADPPASAPVALYSAEIDRLDLRTTRVVVLAGCRTAAGAMSRLEGTFSLARPFLAAGVPSVVASLRDVDDEAVREFSVALHRGLLAGAQPARAVRETQLAFLRDSDPVRSHPSTWAGFVSIGGL